MRGLQNHDLARVVAKKLLQILHFSFIFFYFLHFGLESCVYYCFYSGFDGAVVTLFNAVAKQQKQLEATVDSEAVETQAKKAKGALRTRQ